MVDYSYLMRYSLINSKETVEYPESRFESEKTKLLRIQLEQSEREDRKQKEFRRDLERFPSEKLSEVRDIIEDILCSRAKEVT